MIKSIEKLLLDTQEIKDSLSVFTRVIEKFIKFKQELLEEEN